MDAHDISDIQEHPEEHSKHYLQLSHLYTKEQIVYDSANFSNIFYAKRSMRILLSERNQVSLHLNLSLKGQGISERKKEDIMECLLKIFEENPSKLDTFCLAIIHDCSTAYCFFATDGKYVPLCKKCNASVYVALRETQGRILCSNRHCRKKLLEEFVLVENQQRMSKQKIDISQKIVSPVPGKSARDTSQQLLLAENERDRIKKAARRLQL